MSKDERGVAKKESAFAATQKAEAELDTTGAEARETAEIQAAYVMATKRPRSDNLCFERLVVACKRQSFAEEAEYAFPRGDKQVTGPSVNIAREAARIWGNMRYGLRIIRDDEDNRAIRGWALDLETNAYSEAEDQFKKLIYRKRGGWIKPDERDLRELTNRRGAFLVRNSLLSILPRDYIEDGLAQCHETILAAAIKDKPATIKKMTASFATVGVTAADLEKWLEHPMDAITGAEIVELRGIFKAISDGVSTKDEYFGAGAKPEEGKLKEGDLKPGTPEENRGHDASMGATEQKAKPKPEQPARKGRLF